MVPLRPTGRQPLGIERAAESTFPIRHPAEVTFVPKRDNAFRYGEVRPIQAQRQLREYATKAPVRGYQICIVTGAGGRVVTRPRAVASG